MRSVALWLHNFICVIPECKHTAEEVHHIDKDNLNNQLTNLAPLCAVHHKYAHLSVIDFQFIRLLIIRSIASKLTSYIKF